MKGPLFHNNTSFLSPGFHLYTGLSLAAMCTCVLHGGYVVMGAILLTFLRSPFFSRVTLLFTVSLNAVAEVNQQPALDFTGLSLLILVLTLGRAGRELTWRWSCACNELIVTNRCVWVYAQVIC